MRNKHFFVSILRIFGRLRILAAVCGLASDHLPLRIWASMQKWWPANNAVICTVDSANLGRKTWAMSLFFSLYFTSNYTDWTAEKYVSCWPLARQCSHLSRSDLIVAHLVYYLFWAETIWCRRLKTGCLPRHPECWSLLHLVTLPALVGNN